MRYTPQGTAVTTFGLATNRSWKTDTGEIRDEADFHNIVAWNKLAETCSNSLHKGVKVYVEGRIQTRSYTGQDNVQRTKTEIVIEEMMMLIPKTTVAEEPVAVAEQPKEEAKTENVDASDIPF
ncbi:MAG: single-stranded DNA-binding protein [bacterium]|nr:single-stranded DNA-binding protein [bacterium]